MKTNYWIILCLSLMSGLLLSCKDEFADTKTAGEEFLKKNLEKDSIDLFLTRYDTICGYDFDSVVVKRDTTYVTDTTWNSDKTVIIKIDTTETKIDSTLGKDPNLTVTVPYEDLASYPKKIDEYKIDEYDDVPFKTVALQSFPNGMQYAVYFTVETGNFIPITTDYVYLNYKAYFIDGSVFQQNRSSTDKRVAYGSLPYGVRDALRRMKIGSRWRVWLPASLAYGTSGSESPKVDPNTVLIYDIELLGYPH